MFDKVFGGLVVLVVLFYAVILYGIVREGVIATDMRKPGGTTHYVERGVVATVSECQTRKYGHDCTITLTNGQTFRTDLTDWPSFYIAPGDVILEGIRTKDGTQAFYNCRARGKCQFAHACTSDRCYRPEYASNN